MKLDDLSIFVQVVDHGGFAATERVIGVPKSTLSKRLAELEDDLGVRLIERSSRSFVVTTVGQEVHRHASAMLLEAEAARQVVQGHLAEPTGRVRITASVPTARISLAPILPELASRWPKLTLVLHTSDHFVDMVHDGFDLALRDHFAPLVDSALLQRKLAFDPGILIASPDYSRHRELPESPAALAAHDGLWVAPSTAPWTLRHERSGDVVEVMPTPRFFADDADVLLHAAAVGLGIACLPSKLCRPYLDAGSVHRVLPEWTSGGVTTSLLMPPRRAQLPSVRVVADFLIERLADAP